MITNDPMPVSAAMPQWLNDGDLDTEDNISLTPTGVSAQLLPFIDPRGV